MIWKSREIIIFVSSPSDCSTERHTVRRIIEKMNARPELVSQRLRLKPLLWEDLPPGMAEDGDFQKRISTLIKNGRYDGYGIYVGIMKNRLGTRTPRYASGTIEEFEESLKLRSRVGMPAEVLFYFVDDGSELVAEVAKFKSQVAEKGLLYTTVPVDAFPERFERNLFDIAKSWNKWRAVLRRTWRLLRNYAAAVAVLSVLLIFGYDLFARQSIRAALSAGSLNDARATWGDRNSLMVFSGQAMQRQISAKIETSFAAKVHASGALSFWERWQDEAVLLPQARAAMQARLIDLTSEEISQNILNNRSAQALNVWHETQRTMVWDANPDQAQRTIADIAALRMIEALSTTGTRPETWRASLLTPQQAEQLRLVAHRIVAQDPTFGTWPNREVRTALAVMANRIDVLGALAQQAAWTLDSQNQPEIDAFTALAAPGALSEWLETTISPEIKSHIVRGIIEGVQAREQPAAMLMLHDLALRDRFPGPGVTLLSDLPLVGESLEAQVAAFLSSRAKGAKFHPAVLERLLPHLDVSSLSSMSRMELTELIIDEFDDGLPPIVLDALSQLATQRGRVLVDTELEDHLSGRTSFGFAHREVLMQHIRRTVPMEQRLKVARLLFERSESDRALLKTSHAFRGGGSINDGVERAYLEILTLDAARATDGDRAALERLIDRTVSFEEMRNLQALGAALRVLPERWSVQFLDLPHAPLIDPPWEPVWAKRQIVIAALSSVSGPSLEGFAEKVLRSLPNDEGLQTWLINHVASIGPVTSKAFARHRLKNGKLDSIDVLVALRDIDALLGHVDRIVSAQAPRDDLTDLAEAASNLPAVGRRALIARVVQVLPGEVGHFLELAAQEGYVAEPLERTAEAFIRMPETGRARVGLRYFASTDPERAWRLATQQAFRDWLDRADPFEWVGAMQELPPLGPGEPSKAVVELAVTRIILTGFGIRGYQGEDREIGQMAIAPDVGVVSHVVALLAATNYPKVVLHALARARIESVQTLGNVPSPDRTARAYLTWLAAGPARRAQLDCAPGAWLGSDHLDDADPLTTRTAAALLLAQPRLATLPICPAEVRG